MVVTLGSLNGVDVLESGKVSLAILCLFYTFSEALLVNI